MSRKAAVAGPTISLFPFLAVLLCTMGALLVVLVLFSRSVRQNETAKLDKEQESLVEELELTRESLAWRREQMNGVRERTAEELTKARMQLAGIEESSRGLQDEFAKLERTAAALASQGTTVTADDDTLRGLAQRLTSARESLDKALAGRDTKPPAYAVVPYAGRNGTHRRPLYIECCGDGVFLQPEGIRLSPGDFEGPPGPGNPLASALRAAREHVVATHGGTNDPAAQPYPLLLVRPSGVMAYYAAREAIQSWGSDFGYQLIDEDWTLTFPPADPTLAQVEKRAIDESRARLAWLAEVRPTRPAKPTQQYRAAPTRGGVVADGGPSVLGDQSRWDWKNGQQPGGAAAGGGVGPEGSGGGLGEGGDGSGEGGSGGPGGQGSGIVGRRGGGGLPGSAGAGGADGPGGDAILGGGAGGSAGGRFGAGGQGPGGGAASAVGGRYSSTSKFGGAGGGAASGSLAAAGTSAAGGSGTSAGGTAASAGGTAGSAGGTAGSAGGTAGSAGDSSAAGGGASGGGSGSGTNKGGGSAGGGSGPAMPGLVQSGGAGGGQAGGAAGASASASMAQSRGKNWASLATQDRPIPLTRPIRLECSLHEFRVIDDSGRRVETRIPVPGDTAEVIDPLVAAIHSRVDRWGIAGDRMYWKPQLVLSETADGRSRREDLERLLADSGLDTRSSDVRDVIRPLPPVNRTTAALPAR
jgi:uncharacterized coiled-coil protein SlyX